MATVTIGKSYFEALLRRAEFRTFNRHAKYGTDLSDSVTIGKAEHQHMTQILREYYLLKSALFRGGLTTETLETLIQGESGAMNEEPSGYDYESEHTPVRSRAASMMGGGHDQHVGRPGNIVATQDTHYGLHSSSYNRVASYGEPGSFICSPGTTPDDDEDDQDHSSTQQIPLRDQRTVLITNLPERTAHKDLASIVRGGRLLDIFLRNDRTATISFVEGAAEFLAYAKRNDIYLHMKRLEFRWNDRQFHVPPHVSNKIVNGATRNLVVRGIVGKVTANQIRDHLDHIHNLVVVDIFFKDGDAYISTNSVHNALFARTCMMSRTVYKGTRIEYYSDECAEPLPHPVKAYNPVRHVPLKPAPLVNQYALLDTGSDDDSESEEESYMIHNVQVDSHHWTDGVAA